MHLKSVELTGFKSFAKKSEFSFTSPITAIVGPNGSGKSNVAEAFRFVLGEQSIKSMRGKKGEDLIWGGSDQVPRSGRASAKVVFDNTKRLFDLDFDEVAIERVVHRDGVNQYLINGSQVRLRDVAELLAGANIGSSGHHIISQGEADRILRASPRERREMIEDALGLRSFQYKLAESERKLEKTKENINQVQALRREIAPHLRFLKRQVEKIEKTRSLRDELSERYREYLKREDVYLSAKARELAQKRREPEARLSTLEQELAAAQQTLKQHDADSASARDADRLDTKLKELREKKDALVRELGRLEGRIAAEESRTTNTHESGNPQAEYAVSLRELADLRGEIDAYISEGRTAGDVEIARGALEKIGALLASFFSAKERERATRASSGDTRGGLEGLTAERKEKENALATLDREERDVRAAYEKLRRSVENAKDESREAERRVFQVRAEQQETRATLSDIDREDEQRERAKESFDRELSEGVVLVGPSIAAYASHTISEIDVSAEPREKQEERRRAIEKIKLRLEEAGSGSGEEVVCEYEEAQKRDTFLEHEISDLEKSASSLRELIADLEKQLSGRFDSGIAKINTQFQDFFALMFGGGSASLSVVKMQPRRRAPDTELGTEDETTEAGEHEEGIEVKVHLPRKKVRGLDMLSGGERALTSIALLFAMSQVNPPPFLILDETDAALDEANSRRYGDMVENLAKHSQLILITHNRETMRRAGVLYGITMGRDGASKLLSVQFDEAVSVAK